MSALRPSVPVAVAVSVALARTKTRERMAEQMVGDTWRNIRHDLAGIKLVELLGPNGTIRQVTEPRPVAAKRLKALEIASPPPILRVD